MSLRQRDGTETRLFFLAIRKAKRTVFTFSLSQTSKMAGVAADLLFLHPLQEEDIEEGTQALNSFIYNDIDTEICGPDPFFIEFDDFPPSDRSLHESISINHAGDHQYLEIEDENPPNIDFGRIEDSDSIFFDCHDQVSLALHLFEQCSQRTDVVDIVSETNPSAEIVGGLDFGVFWENDEMGSNLFEMGLGLGLDFSVSRENDEMGPVSQTVEGLRIVGFGYDFDSREEGAVGVDLDLISDGEGAIADDLGFSLQLDCLRLQERRDPNEDFDWEEVDIRVDQAAVLSMMVAGAEGEDVGLDSSLHEMGNAGPSVEAMQNLEWEVLWPVNGFNGDLSEVDAEFDHDQYNEAAEYEVLLGQFVDNEISLRSSPPASNSVVENLQTVVLTREDAENNNTVCAVCKDEISLGEQVKRLPCSHHYHGDCILPWLRIRNTCPVCRFELPTDDPDYEQRRAQMGTGHGLGGESHGRYDL